MKRNTFTKNNLLNSFRMLSIAVTFLFTFQASAQLIGWNTTGVSGYGVSPWAPQTLAPNLTMVTGLSRGTSVTATSGAAGDCWGGNGGWGTTDAGSVYFVFKANTGYQVSLTAISSAIRRSNSGPTPPYTVSYSLNGGAYTVVGTWNAAVTSGTTGGANSTTLSTVPALQNIAAGVEVRFRITFAAGSANNWYLTGGANALRLTGTVTAAAPPCAAPAGLTAANTTDATSDLSWTAQGSNSFQYVVNTTAADPSGAGTATAGTTFNATGLQPNTVHYLHVRTDCGGTFSPWTTLSFTTLFPPCPVPTGLAAANTSATTSDLSWDAQGSNNFEYVVNTTATDPAAAGTFTTGTTFSATALTPATIYYLHVRTDCDDGNLSPWTTFSFTTLVAPCIAPTGLAAANTSATTSDLSWNAQGSSSFEYVVNTTSTDPSTAGTATAGTTFNATALTPQTVYYLHVRTDCGGGNLSPWTTFSFTTLVAPCIAPTGLAAANTSATTSDLSWNAQGSSSFEYVVNTTSTDPSTAGTATAGTTFNATALTPETVYYLHVRTDCGGGNFSPWTTFSFTTLVAPCIAPTGLAAANTSATTSDLSWNAQGSSSFEYVVNTTSADPATAGTATTGTTFNATALTPETGYYLHVRTDCGGGNLSPWTTFSFTTDEAVCAAPSGLSVLNVSFTSADLLWSTQPGITGFEYVIGQTAAAPAGAGTATINNAFGASALSEGATYYFHVRTNCGNGNFSDWTTLSFQTLSDVGIAEEALAGFTAYPNPSNGIVSMQSAVQQGTVVLTNLKGQQLVTADLAVTTTIDLSDFDNGLYFLTYTLNGQHTSLKLIKQ